MINIFERFEKRQREYEIIQYQRNIDMILIPFFYRHGKISIEEYTKWILDETGKFRPKLNK